MGGASILGRITIDPAIRSGQPSIRHLRDVLLYLAGGTTEDEILRAAERGFIDDAIGPHETRERLIRSLRMLETKVETMPRKKHGNIPL